MQFKFQTQVKKWELNQYDPINSTSLKTTSMTGKKYSLTQKNSRRQYIGWTRVNLD
jgi:hypothetical protein